MMSTEPRRRMLLLASTYACVVAIGYGTLAPMPGALPIPEVKLSDASSFLNLFPPVKEPASNPGGSR